MAINVSPLCGETASNIWQMRLIITYLKLSMKDPGFIRTTILVMCFSSCLLLSGCQNQPARSPNEKRFDLTGKVISVDRDKQLVTVAHEEIKDYMPAMTMSFTVRDKWVFEIIKAGDRIAAAYVVDGTNSWLEEVVITKESADESTSVSPNIGAKPGDEVPNYRLINQHGDPVRLQDYKGKALLLTFIFTRCQDPDQCTLMSSNFASINQELQKQAEIYDKTHLLSISFDPEYDTPAVLRSYGAAYTGRYSDETFDHWEFASGSADEVKGVAQFFGLRYYKDAETGNEQMIHTLTTALIGPDSKVVKIYRGNEWKVSEVLGDIKDTVRGISK